MHFNELVCWGGLHTKILNKTQWQRHTGNCYFILNLDHVNVDYSAANIHAVAHATFEPRCEKTGHRGFRPGPTQTGLYNHRNWLEA